MTARPADEVAREIFDLSGSEATACGRIHIIATLHRIIEADRRAIAEKARKICAGVANKWTRDMVAAANQFDKDGSMYGTANYCDGVAEAIRSLDLAEVVK